MKLNERVLDELEIYATRVGLNDHEALARFHQECTPERILAMVEQVRAKRERVCDLEDRIVELECEVEDLICDRDYYKDRCQELQQELEELR